MKMLHKSFDNTVTNNYSNKVGVILVGAAGGLGSFVFHALNKIGIPTYCLSRKELYGFILWESHEYYSFMNWKKTFCLDRVVVVNLAGWGNVNGCEKNVEKSLQDNAKVVLDLHTYLSKLMVKFHFIQMSTNDVFGQGFAGNDFWTTQDRPMPQCMYAFHKLQAESNALYLFDLSRTLILRGTFMTPVSKSKGGDTFYYKAYKSLMNGEDISGYVNQLSCPVSVDTLADIIVSYVEKAIVLEKMSIDNIVHVASKFYPNSSVYDYPSRFDILNIMEVILKNKYPHSKIGTVTESVNAPGHTRNAVLEPASYDIIQEVRKFVDICEVILPNGNT